MRRMGWVDELCVCLCNRRSAGSVCLPWLPHVREHSVHGVQSERMQLMGQSTTQLSDSVQLLSRPSCRETSSLERTGCRLAWLKQLARAFQRLHERTRSEQVVIVSTGHGNKPKPVRVKLISGSWKWEDILAQDWGSISMKAAVSTLHAKSHVSSRSLHVLPAHTFASPQPFHRCERSRGDAGGNLPRTRRSHSAGMCSSLQHRHTPQTHSQPQPLGKYQFLVGNGTLLCRRSYLRLGTDGWSRCCWGCRALIGPDPDRVSLVLTLGVGGCACSCSWMFRGRKAARK